MSYYQIIRIFSIFDSNLSQVEAAVFGDVFLEEDLPVLDSYSSLVFKFVSFAHTFMETFHSPYLVLLSLYGVQLYILISMPAPYSLPSDDMINNEETSRTQVNEIFLMKLTGMFSSTR